MIPYNLSVTLTAAPNVGWGFDRWSGDVSGTNKRLMFVMKDNTTAIATFVKLVPNLDATGSLSWVGVPRDSTVTGEIQVKNVGIAGSKLNWSIISYPAWGNWTFTPPSGTGLTPANSPFNVSVSIVAPHIKKKQTFSGNVTLVNSDDPSDMVVLPVSMAVPYRPLTLLEVFFHWLIEHFPMLQRIGLSFQ
jgi:hypothetical protein